jgi:hypothetical protein
MSFMSVSTADPVGKPIDEARLRALVPSLFATEAHGSRSARFSPIPTIDIVKGLEREGWLITRAQQQRTTDDRRAYTKHLIRLRHRSSTAAVLGGTFPEVVLVNANDGAASYRMAGGLFRLVCLNGAVVGDQVQRVTVPHRGDVASKVIEGSFRVLEETTQLAQVIEPWRRLQLSRGEKMAFAEAAHEIRFGETQADGTVVLDTPIRPAQLLTPRRWVDGEDNLWTVFNVVQENALRGGLRGIGMGANGRPRRTTTREIRGIEQDVKLNSALFTLAARMAEMKGVA